MVTQMVLPDSAVSWGLAEIKQARARRWEIWSAHENGREFAEIAREYGITRERARQIYNKMENFILREALREI